MRRKTTDSKTLPTRIFELADNNTKTVITSFHVFRKFCGDMEIIF